MGRFEVTFDEWAACVRGGGCQSNRSPYDNTFLSGRRPIDSVTWDDAQEYVSWLSSTTGQSYFLPNDGQWEFAARASTNTRFWWGDDPSYERANLGGPAGGGATSGRDRWVIGAPVGQFVPNQFGVFDTAGNVAEWVNGCMQPPASDGSCAQHASRGGSYCQAPEVSAVGLRTLAPESRQPSSVGFRVARALVETPQDASPAP